MDLDLGPLINADRQRGLTCLKGAADEGVPLFGPGSGGRRNSVPGAAAVTRFSRPVFGPVPRSNALACEEVFGPVLSVLPFADEATEAVRWRSATPSG